MTTGCAAPRHDGQEEPTETEYQAHLCRLCRLGLLWDLRRLPGLHADLEQLPATGDGDGSGLPFSEPAADCRSQIRHDLAYWARQVTGDRRCELPYSLDWEADGAVSVLAGWLAGQVTWCSFRDWAPDMAGAIAADRQQASALLSPFIKREFEIPGPDGICLHCEDSEPANCGECGHGFAEGALHLHRQRIEGAGIVCMRPGAVRLVLDRHGKWSPRCSVTVYASDGDRRRSFIGCPGCGLRWEPEQWMSYGRQVIRRREAMAS